MANPKIQLRHDTAANWTSVNPVLLEGEVGIETDTKKQKIGDGSTSWNSLAYQIQDFISNIPVGLNLSIDSGILSAQAGHVTSQTDILKTSSVISTADISTIPNGVTNGVILGETLQYQDVDLTSGVTYIYADADGTSLNTMTENSKGAWLIASSSQGRNSSSWAHYGLVFNTPLQAGQYKFSVSTGTSYGFLYACSGEIGNFTIISTIVNNEQNPQDVEVNIGSPIDALVWVVGNYNGWSAPYGLEVQKYESAKVFKTYLCKDNNSYSLKLATDTSALSSFDDYAQIGQVEYDNTLLNPVATPTEDLKNTFVNAQLANKDLSNLSTTGNAKFQAPLVSGTNIKTVNNTSLLGSGNIDTSEVFIAEYGVTTFADIETAYNAGKVVFCKYNNFLYVLQQFMAVDEAIFTAIKSDSSSIIHCNHSTSVGINGWFAQYNTLETTISKVTSISIASTDTQYPSAKCVYNELTNKADTDLSNLSATGQAVIDGDFVSSAKDLSSVKAVGSYTIDLQSYLPSDGAKYEVWLTGSNYTSGSTYSRYKLYTDIMNAQLPVNSNGANYSWITHTGTNSREGCFLIKVPVQRYIYEIIEGASLNDRYVPLTAIGYRRLGTNS